MRSQRQPYKTYEVGGKSFPVYIEYDEQFNESYPDFEHNLRIRTGPGRSPRRSRRDACNASPALRGKTRSATVAGEVGFTGNKCPMTHLAYACALRRRKNGEQKD